MAVFKKILASTLALAAIAAAGTTTAAAVENDYTRSWSINYTFGAPSYVSNQVASVSLTYIGVGY